MQKQKITACVKGLCQHLFLLITLLCNSAVTAAEDTIKVVLYGDGAYPPYSYEEKGSAQGIYADILRLAAQRLKGYEVQLIPVPWNRSLNLIKNGLGFAFYPPYLRREERPFIAPYSIPILAEELVVVCRDDVFRDKNPKHWPEEFSGLRISKNLGFAIFDATTREAVKQSRIKIEESANAEQNLKKMIAGRTDCYVNDKAAIYWELKKLRATNDYRPDFHGEIVVYSVLSAENGYIGYSALSDAFPFKDDFVKQMDAALAALQEEGEINRILERYLTH